MRLAGLAFVILGCGRIGFDPTGVVVTTDGDGGVIVPPDHILVQTTAGAAIVAETDGSRYVANETGTALVPATSPTTLHVVFTSNTIDTEVFTAVGVDPGSNLVVGRGVGVASNPTHMTVTLPAAANATQYAIRGGEACVQGGLQTTPGVSVAFQAGCSGTGAHLIAFALQMQTVIGYLDLGTVTLATNGTFTATGSWSALVTYTLAVHGADVIDGQTVGEQLLELDTGSAGGISLDPTDSSPAGTVTGGGVTLASSPIPPFANELVLTAMPTMTTSTTLTLHPALAPGSNTVDASAMLPLLAAPTYSNTTIGATWPAPPPTSADFVIYKASVMKADSTFIGWTIYAPPTTTSVTFPALPADLDPVPEPGEVYYGSDVFLVDVLGLDRKAAWAVVYDGSAPAGVATSWRSSF